MKGPHLRIFGWAWIYKESSSGVLRSDVHPLPCVRDQWSGRRVRGLSLRGMSYAGIPSAGSRGNVREAQACRVHVCAVPLGPDVVPLGPLPLVCWFVSGLTAGSAISQRPVCRPCCIVLAAVGPRGCNKPSLGISGFTACLCNLGGAVDKTKLEVL